MDGLKRLEYRGYDSAGVALINGQGLSIQKNAGKISALQQMIDAVPLSGSIGIAHTRWATHGEPTTNNAHPHVDGTGDIAIVHNGIIENYQALKAKLQSEGHTFTTDTDTEVLAHLIEKYHNGSLEEAVATALALVEGTYGIAVVSKREPEKVVGARMGSPLVVGVGDGEYWVASDVSAILRYTKNVVYLDDGEMVVITPNEYRTTTIDGRQMDKEVQEVEWELEQIEKGGHPHFMLKEIFEQPQSIQNAFRGRLVAEEGSAKLGGLNMERNALRLIDRITIIGCGTSWHSSMIGEYMLEEVGSMPVEVEYASEFRYRKPIIKAGTVVLAVSQSGETIDTLAAMREAQKRGAPALGIVNVVGSTIARESDGGVYTHAGPEIGVASTKAFTSQIAVLAVLTLCLARLRGMSEEEGRHIVREIQAVPEKIERIFETDNEIQKIAKAYSHHNNFLYLGRGFNFPVALEGALKLKEISYIHAEGYPAAEMKHGPIALIDDHMPVVFICIQDSAYDKVLSNMEEVRARKGKIIAVASEGDDRVKEKADHVIYVPRTEEMLYPLLTVIPLQLLAYHIAVERGCNVDQPRNLAKSVTVE
jgi:glucosamine--fructose-6-phosphate aminotransferase (isomerizing)